MAKELFICIACDTDPDRIAFNRDATPDKLHWRGLLEGIPRGKEHLAKIIDSSGKSPIVTWCLRVDHQIREYTGAFDFVLREFGDSVKSLESVGDEIGWHPHFWRRQDSDSPWYQEFADVDWQVEMLKSAHGAFSAIHPTGTNSVRMGWIYHNNRTMQELDKLGVRVELSASPGLCLLPRNQLVKGQNYYDWSISPDMPYHPSRADYRRPAKGGEESLRIWEIPCLMSRSWKWSVIAGGFLSLKMKSPRPLFQSIKRPSHFINISGKPNIFRPLLASLENRLKIQNRVLFTTYFHADEWLPVRHPFYSLESTAENLRAIMTLCQRLNVRVQYIRARDCLTLL
jgi:hypothetical protein